MEENLKTELSSKDYWPAVAMKYLDEEKYSRAVELCNLRLKEYPESLSGRIALALALFYSGQFDSAEMQFYDILKRDPENMIALKYIGDIKFRMGDEATAISLYERILQIDPLTNGLSSPVKRKQIEETKVLTLKKGREEITTENTNLREIPFKTETVGDLLMSQGHTRLALEVYRELARSGNPRLTDKFEKAKEALKTGKGK